MINLYLNYKSFFASGRRSHGRRLGHCSSNQLDSQQRLYIFLYIIILGAPARYQFLALSPSSSVVIVDNNKEQENEANHRLTNDDSIKYIVDTDHPSLPLFQFFYTSDLGDRPAGGNNKIGNKDIQYSIYVYTYTYYTYIYYVYIVYTSQELSLG